ncbi:MAG: carboxymuconolactone decarboxylase family protein [Burkholderia sp.]
MRSPKNPGRFSTGHLLACEEDGIAPDILTIAKGLGTGYQPIGAFYRYDTGLPLRLSELAILATAARWRSQAEWHIHLPIALEAGVPAAVAEAIRRGETPVFDNADDALIHRFATELYDTQRVSDATYDAALARFGHEVVINLVGLLGYYALVAMTLNVFGMRANGQQTLPFEE